MVEELPEQAVEALGPHVAGIPPPKSKLIGIGLVPVQPKAVSLFTMLMFGA